MVELGVHAKELVSETSFSRLYICPWRVWRLPQPAVGRSRRYEVLGSPHTVGSLFISTVMRRLTDERSKAQKKVKETGRERLPIFYGTPLAPREAPNRV
jgi:hypothetical protein